MISNKKYIYLISITNLLEEFNYTVKYLILNLIKNNAIHIKL